MMEMIHESIDKQGMPYHGPVTGLISIADNKFRRNKGAHKYRERILAQLEELFVDINVRMDSTAMWADYLLPAASHYEAWDLRSVGYHRFVNVFTAPVDPVGEALPDWDIMAMLTKKIQERAGARGAGAYEDGSVTRNLDTIHDDFTMGGAINTAYDATRWLVDNSPEIEGTLEEGAKRGFFVMNDKASGHSTLRPDAVYNPFEHQVVDKKLYPTLSGRITFYCDHDRYIKLGARVPTARRHAGKEASNYPLHFYTPHTRWGIHSNWRSNKFMMRLQRGEPNVYINPRLAAARGIADGDKVQFALKGAGVTPHLMGVPGAPVNIWYWKADDSAENLAAGGPGSTTRLDDQPLGAASVHGKAAFAPQDQWVVVMSRALGADGTHMARLDPAGEPQPLAFAIWQGADGERDGHKNASPGWILLDLSPLAGS